MHSATFAIDLLAGPDEGVASDGTIIELNAAILLGFDGEDECIDLVASLCGEFEQRAVVLSVCWFRWFYHRDCCWS